MTGNEEPTYTTRDRCGGCGADSLEQFLDLGDSPLANTLPKTDVEKQPRYPLRVAVCRMCYLVQLLDVVSDAELFAGDYAFYSGTSPALARYHERYAREVLLTWGEQARRLTVEIACNDGSLLSYFRDADCPAVGIDPAPGPTIAARKRGLDVITDSFGTETAAGIREMSGRAGLIIANNVAAHVSDVNDFFAGIADLLADDGVALIEVQYVGDLLLGNQFDHVYHEHRFFFSVTSLRSICRRAGLNIIDVEETSPQGGSVRITASRRHPHAMRDPICETWLQDVNAYHGLQGRARRVRERLLRLLDDERCADRYVAGWAAPAKAVTLLNYCGVGPEVLTHIVDTTPTKSGRYLPGTRIPITGPGDRNSPDTYLVLAWNYLGTLLRTEHSFIINGGRIITPIPVPVAL